MRAPRPIVIGMCSLGVAGGVPATLRDAAQMADEPVAISPDATAARGTAMPPGARAGYVMLDSRSRIEPGPTRYHYRGGAAS
jgi:hypothetical protein